MPVLMMLDKVSLAFGHLPLLDEIDLRIEAGERLSVVGRNGTGKSSLLKILSGDIQPDAGTVWRAPGLNTARLDQEVPAGEDRTVFDAVAEGLGELGDLVRRYHAAALRVADGDHQWLDRVGELQHELELKDAWRLEQRVETVVSRLRLPADRRVSDLSGGWRRRVLLARALVAAPQLLLLDEPTNHLDIEAIAWLEEYLLGLQSGLVFVTHDRALLDRVATRVVDLDRGRLTSWPGTYTEYIAGKTAALAAEAQQEARFDKLLEQEEAWIRKGIKARRTRNEGRVRALEAMRLEHQARRDRTGQVRMDLDRGDVSGRIVFEAESVSKTFEGVEVIRNFSTRIVRGDRVGLIGPNGSGKTTLLKLLLGELEPDEGRIGRGTRVHVAYYDQERSQLDPNRTVADSVNDGNDVVTIGDKSRHVIGYLKDFLFPAERAQSPVSALSGGERNRLLLARLFARPANVLVMDEPTNDLDIETLELLEELIADFAGTILLVSHDRVFLDRVVTSTLAFEGNGTVREYVGGYNDWVRQVGARAAASHEAETANPKVPQPRRERSAGPRRLSYKEQRQLDSLPERIEALEGEKKQLEDDLHAPDFYKQPPDVIARLLARLDELRRETEEAYAEWYALQSIRDNQ